MSNRRFGLSNRRFGLSNRRMIVGFGLVVGTGSRNASKMSSPGCGSTVGMCMVDVCDGSLTMYRKAIIHNFGIKIFMGIIKKYWSYNRLLTEMLHRYWNKIPLLLIG